MASKIKVDQLETADGSGTIALQNQLSGMTTASLPALGSAQMPTGSVLQVVYGMSQTIVTTTSNSGFTSTGVTATITPSSTSSKIWIITKVTGRGTSSTDTLTAIYRGTVSGTNLTGNASTKYNHSNSEPSDIVNTYLDSPNTTSATTYTLGIKPSVNGQTVYANDANTEGTITLMEIAG